jgi:hypothetical protein
MEGTFSGELARVRCSRRTREELIEYAPRRPLAFRDELRVTGMKARCTRCGACPLMIRALAIMLPPPAEKPSNVVELKRAS